MQTLRLSYHFLVDRSADELIRAGFVLVVLSLVVGGVHALARRKLQDGAAASIVAALVASVASAILAVGYAAGVPGASPSYTAENPPPGGFGPGMVLGPYLLRLADADGDGRLTPGEAAGAAERFVRESDRAREGSLDVGGLSGAINRNPPAPFGPSSHRLRPTRSLAAHLAELLDGDKDGQVTSDELGRFVRQTDPTGRGEVDVESIADNLDGRRPSPRPAQPPR